jgi:hypothetical protein
MDFQLLKTTSNNSYKQFKIREQTIKRHELYGIDNHILQ